MSEVTQPQTDLITLERQAAELVAEHLGLAEEDVHSAASLFDLAGFDSLTVVAVLDGLEERVGREVPPERIVPEAFESLGSLAALFMPVGPAGSHSQEEGTI